MMRLFVFLGASLLGLSTAHADLCEWNAKPIAQAAIGSLTPGSTIQYYCKNCGDKEVKGEAINTAAIEKVPDIQDDLYVIKVNGHSIDIAYVFVKQGSGWLGLGALAKCSDDTDMLQQLPEALLPK